MNTQTETDTAPAKKKCCGGCKAGMKGHAPCHRKANAKAEKKNETDEALDYMRAN